MAMKQTDVSKHQHLIPNTPTCPRAIGGKQGREGGPVIFSPTLLPGKLNLLMRPAAAACLLQLARQVGTHPRSMRSLSINQSSSYLHSSRACLLGLQTFNQCYFLKSMQASAHITASWAYLAMNNGYETD